MSRGFCVLPQGFSDGIALDCERHIHKNRREIEEAITLGEIEPYDIHPVTLKQRFISRVHPIHAILISGADIQRGAHHKVLNYRKARNAINDRIAEGHQVALPGTEWNEAGIITDGAKTASNPVYVTLKARSPDGLAIVNSYRHFSFAEIRLTDEPSKEFRVLRKARVSEMREALARLDSFWGHIVSGCSAGPYSEDLTAMNASHLPSSILHKILRAYVRQA